MSALMSSVSRFRSYLGWGRIQPIAPVYSPGRLRKTRQPGQLSGSSHLSTSPARRDRRPGPPGRPARLGACPAPLQLGRVTLQPPPDPYRPKKLEHEALRGGGKGMKRNPVRPCASAGSTIRARHSCVNVWTKLLGAFLRPVLPSANVLWCGAAKREGKGRAAAGNGGLGSSGRRGTSVAADGWGNWRPRPAGLARSRTSRWSSVGAVSVFQTIGVFVGIPLVIYAVLALLTVVPARARRRPRYKPGEPWEYPPQWWSGDRPVVTSASGPSGREGGARGSW